MKINRKMVLNYLTLTEYKPNLWASNDSKLLGDCIRPQIAVALGVR